MLTGETGWGGVTLARGSLRKREGGFRIRTRICAVRGGAGGRRVAMPGVLAAASFGGEGRGLSLSGMGLC